MERKMKSNRCIALSWFSLFLILTMGSCSDYSPKPKGYFRIEIPDHNYTSFTNYPQFEFDISTQVVVKEVPDTTEGEWFNLIYPSLNAQIFCSYLPITKDRFAENAEESRKFVYFHVIKAESIKEEAFQNPEQNVYGIVYEVAGNVATPIQFVLTDSIRSFFRGALYFDNPPNQDSIVPVLEYINKDIQVIIESFRWKI